MNRPTSLTAECCFSAPAGSGADATTVELCISPRNWWAGGLGWADGGSSAWPGGVRDEPAAAGREARGAALPILLLLAYPFARPCACRVPSYWGQQVLNLTSQLELPQCGCVRRC